MHAYSHISDKTKHKESYMVKQMYSGHFAIAPDGCKILGLKDTESMHDGGDDARTNKFKEVSSPPSFQA